MRLPDTAVEAAAKAGYEYEHPSGPSWDDIRAKGTRVGQVLRWQEAALTAFCESMGFEEEPVWIAMPEAGPERRYSSIEAALQWAPHMRVESRWVSPWRPVEGEDPK